LVSRVVFLDAGPLGLVTNPRRSPRSTACAQWLQSLVSDGTRVIVPEIADYEVRRELLRANKQKGIAQLDGLVDLLEYLPITTAAMRQAAVFWAEARQRGQPTAGDKTIDSDMILAAQGVMLGVSDIVIATTNVGHLTRFVPADLWQNITSES
jgi:predicted nucleic acid-binding protein